MRLRRRQAPEQDAAATADTVLRLAVLLQAGIAPARAWTHLAAAGDATAERIERGVAAGDEVPRAIAQLGGSWSAVASAWTVAATVGAPLAESLRGIVVALRDAQETSDEVRVALAEPAGTARLMGWLPLVAVLLGVALGFDTFGVLIGNPMGVVCLAAGMLLIAVAQRWTRALVRKARTATGIPGLEAELLAIGLSGGVSIERARRIVADTTAEGTDASIDTTLALSRLAGVPAVELLRATAALARHRARTDGRLRAARLSSQLLLPLGVCTLPAFLLLGVAPMLLSVLSSTSIPI
ncbi:pilus assembly protein TadB [Microbacterium sp. Root61]|uniref:type II secretion system F family protein n=1 Tax=Microbacterium sp. Root61 TaxID=1736570 RepID=UPI0006F4C982|nr:type II secretion system F family protein [Microbacterium sp. Root61]KRA24165.1 pilus assembly protein TadB [Microbacterium sp. Root61]